MISEMFLFSDEYDGFSNHQGGPDGEDDLPFVTGAIWHRPRGVRVQMRRREPPRKNRPPPGSGGGKSSNDSKDAAARLLTSKIKQAKSAAELLDLLAGVVDGPIFNHFHASAAYTSLATWKRQGGLTTSDKASPVLPRLAARVQDMALKGELESRQLSNVLWSLGQLSDDLVIFKGLLTALVQTVGETASSMNAQDLSNNLLACVQLKVVAREVLTVLPKLAAQTSIKAKDMKPQELANSLWASAQLKDDASHEDVAKIVAALVRQIPDKAKDMIPQALSNCLWAAARLKDIAPGVKEIVPAIVAQIPEKANGMIPQHVSNCLWAATRLKDSVAAVLQMVPTLVEEIPRNQADFSSQQICNCLEALVLLQDSVPEVGSILAAAPNSKNDFMGFSANRFSALLSRLKGKDMVFAVPVVVWACARFKMYREKLLVSVAGRLKSGSDVKTLPDWGLCALQWSYDVLDPEGRFAEFKDALEFERVQRGLSDSDVSTSALGIFEWNRAKGQETTS